MSTPRLLICFSRMDPAPWVEQLQGLLPTFQVDIWSPGAAPADYAIVWQPSQQFFDEQGERLRAVFNAGAGVDALLRLDLPSHLQVVRLEDAGMAVQMAEYVCHEVIHYFREFAHYESAQRRGQWAVRPLRPRQAFPVGILGLGRLGERVARAVSVFDFPTLGWSRSAKHIDGVHTFAGDAGLLPFLRASRILVNMLPLTQSTRGLLNRDTLGQLQPGGIVINVARGDHLVEADLLALLDAGQLHGATLDVFAEEPLPPDHAFWNHPGIRLTPHVSAATQRSESIEQIATKLLAMVAGEPVGGVVDRARGY